MLFSNEAAVEMLENPLALACPQILTHQMSFQVSRGTLEAHEVPIALHQGMSQSLWHLRHPMKQKPVDRDLRRAQVRSPKRILKKDPAKKPTLHARGDLMSCFFGRLWQHLLDVDLELCHCGIANYNCQLASYLAQPLSDAVVPGIIFLESLGTPPAQLRHQAWPLQV